MNELWTMRDGTEIPVSDMTELHVRNALKMVVRNFPHWANHRDLTEDRVDAMTEAEARDALCSRIRDRAVAKAILQDMEATFMKFMSRISHEIAQA